MLEDFQSLLTSDTRLLTQAILIEREKRLNLLKELIFEKQKVKQLENFIETTLREEPKKMIFEEKVIEKTEDLPKIGAYSHSDRRKKILHYKQKVKKYREHVKISRSFKGRSIAAKQKARLNGKFAKKIDP